mgnify:CR=1 FL=1
MQVDLQGGGRPGQRGHAPFPAGFARSRNASASTVSAGPRIGQNNGGDVANPVVETGAAPGGVRCAMAHLCIFGSHAGQLVTGRDFFITIFGGMDLRRPPTATHLLQVQQQRPQDRVGSQYTFFTLFGGVDLVWPTLAEEYVALRDAVASGKLRLEDWDVALARPERSGPLAMISFTLFGGVNEDVVPSEEKELDDLSYQQHLGQIPQATADLLVLAIGQRGSQRLAAVRHAVARTLAGG